ncbi:uncharacterized protein LOC129728269 [Wyeomyia smithii]|uniref:uncharacterized protein LOC129728269 n=1 Tax=Wyeomyia smithii TaxID=174621 RepID=UPI002467FF96|nr:uncharacterized protein LOC129728269 [Wyeomyia smithii]
MDDDRRTQQLNARRTTLLASIHRTNSFLQEYVPERDSFEVALRLENLEVLWQGLEEVQSELEILEITNGAMVRNLQFRSDFEPKLFRIKAGLISKIPASPSAAHLPQNPPTLSHSGLAGLKLPTISLPEFAGDYQDWLAFHDTFLALIHSNQEVADIQKFHYLRAAVKGDAAQVIESISISSANYRLAWEALVSRYSNEYLLKKRHLQASLETPRMAEESATALHGLVDEFERHTKVLRQLGEPTDAWSTMLEHLLCTRLHNETLRLWEDHASTLPDPTYTNLIEFLQRRIRVLESISVNCDAVQSISGSHTAPMVKHGPSDKNGKSSHLKMVAHAVTEPSPKKSNVGGRTGIQWRELKKLPLQERLNHVNQKLLCFNCLRSDHYVSNCPIQNSCRICQKRHNTVLHPGYLEGIRKDTAVSGGTRPLPTAQTNVTTTQKQPELNTATVETYLAAASTQSHRSGNVFKLTVILVIVDAYGQHHFARALLDSASQPNLLTERMAQLLKLKRKRVKVQLQGPGGIGIRAKDTVTTQIRSRKESFALDVEFLILPQLTADLPERNISIADWNIPKDLFLADPTFNERGPIDMIIGLPHFFDCFRSPARIRIARDLPEMVDSVFGWIVAGSGLERFWKVEELPSRDDYSAEERECENLYTSTVARDRSGRYIVRLPRHPDFHSMLGESKAAALRRFRLLEQRLEREAEMKEEYHRFMREYISLGHMRLLGMNQHSSGNFYLPHHPVVKESSTTTKVRVVFDGSAKSSTGVSLNEALLTGPVVQDDLLSIVLRFRKFPVALVADIEKMYRQVLIHPEDTPYQRILCRFNESDPIQTYALLTVTYGLAPSSFLATRTLQQLADDEGTAYPLADPILRKNFYVDDCLGGAQSVDEALQLRHELTELLSKGGLTLRKWTSNKIEVLQGLSSEQIGTQSSFVFAPQESVKALGIGWEPETDELRFESKISGRKAPETKRSILSSISQLFDPLGLIAPVVIRSKMFMQELWLAHCDWDQPVPNAIQEKWKTYHRDLAGIAEYRIDRYAFLPNAKVQLHTFSNASESAYGACVYARSTDTHDNVRVKLLASKSRVAPLDRITLPRLELCAAEIASQLYAHVKTALQLEISDARFWSDSTVTLQWLQAPPRTWKTFVANRVSKIQTLTHGYRWTHIPGKDNPADLVSRGMAVGEFVSSELWKYGPTWLRLPEENGLHLSRCMHQSTTSKPGRPGTSQLLSVTQLEEAKVRLIQIAQADEFSQEIKELQAQKPLHKQSQIRALNPFIDQQGTITQIRNKELSRPQILPSETATRWWPTNTCRHARNILASSRQTTCEKCD